MSDDAFRQLLARTQHLAHQIKKKQIDPGHTPHPTFQAGGALPQVSPFAVGNLQWQHHQEQQFAWHQQQQQHQRQQQQQQQQQLLWHQQQMLRAGLPQSIPEQGLLQGFAEPQIHLPMSTMTSGSSDDASARSSSLESHHGLVDAHLRSVSLDSELAYAGVEELLDSGIWDETKLAGPSTAISPSKMVLENKAAVE